MARVNLFQSSLVHFRSPSILLCLINPNVVASRTDAEPGMRRRAHDIGYVGLLSCVLVTTIAIHLTNVGALDVLIILVGPGGAAEWLIALVLTTVFSRQGWSTSNLNIKATGQFGVRLSIVEFSVHILVIEELLLYDVEAVLPHKAVDRVTQVGLRVRDS